MPSLYEGFGFPVLEAQAQGVPVACSNAGSLPEVTRQSAELFDPESIDDMAETLARCIKNPELNLKLRKLARENAASYSWKDTAAEYLKCYDRVTSADR
jgi:glycosyltransferase involved in cell wall biosynthesis